MSYTIEQIKGELDKPDFYPMIHIAKGMPDEYEPKDLPHPGLESYFLDKANPTDTESALFVARQDKPFNHVVGLVGVEVVNEPDGRAAHVNELAVSPREWGNSLGKLLLNSVSKWSEEHEATTIILDTPPEPESAAFDILADLDFEPTEDGRLERPIVSES